MIPGGKYARGRATGAAGNGEGPVDLRYGPSETDPLNVKR